MDGPAVVLERIMYKGFEKKPNYENLELMDTKKRDGLGIFKIDLKKRRFLIFL